MEKNETLRRIALPGGGSVEVKSGDNADGLRGEGLDGVVLDEAAFLDEYVWEHAIRPSLSDKEGWAMFLSTPNGRNWFYELVVNHCGMRIAECGMKEGLKALRGEADEGSHGLVDEPATLSLPPGGPSAIPHSALHTPHFLWAAWQLPTSQNPLIRLAELDEAKKSLGNRVFAQEYEAQFTDMKHAEFPGVYFDGVAFDRWPDEKDVRLRVMALDPSKGKGDRSDYSAFVMIMLDVDGVMWIDAVLERLDVRQIIDRGLALARSFRPHAFGVEANQFQEVLCHIFQDRLREENFYLPLAPLYNATDKPTRIRAQLTHHLARREFRFRNSPGTSLLLTQLKEFPRSDYDDGPDALEMAVRLIKQTLGGGREEDLVERVVA
jgi:predicted phage terminase large subunit-like protein